MTYEIQRMKRYFTYTDEKTDKFWSIDIIGETITIVYGKGHTLGVTRTKKMESLAEAEGEVENMIREKERHGYRETVEKVVEKFGQADFWSLIERAKTNSEDVENQVELLTEYLAQRSVDDIFEFRRIIDQHYAYSFSYDLWGAAYLMNEKELDLVYGIALEELKGRVPCRAGGREPNTAKQVLDFLKHAERAGMEAAQIYSLELGHAAKPNVAEMELYYNTVVPATRLPVYLSCHHSSGYVPPVALRSTAFPSEKVSATLCEPGSAPRRVR